MTTNTSDLLRYSLSRCTCSLCGGGRCILDIEDTYPVRGVLHSVPAERLVEVKP